LNPNKDLIEKIDRNEPTGEVLPLTASDTAQRMGDRYQRTKPKLLDDQTKTKYVVFKIIFILENLLADFLAFKSTYKLYRKVNRFQQLLIFKTKGK
jgi:hypothetical protein